LPSCPLQLPDHLPPPLSQYTPITLLKFPPHYSYYTDGSFIPPKFINNEQWQCETVGYGVYNSTKNINISERLPGLQNILRAELIAIHHTIQLINRQFPTEPAHIFTDNLNSLYLLNMQITHPTHHNNHLDKLILASMVHMLQNRTHPLSIYKVRAHINILGNEHADKLAKAGNTSPIDISK
jgi:ribonuclease HI